MSLPYFNTFTDQPNLTFISVNQTVNDGDVVWLNCSADGFPAPNIAWTRLFTNRNVHMPLTITGKQDEGFYVCTAENGIGNPATADVFVTVQCKSQLSHLFLNKDDSPLSDSKKECKSALSVESGSLKRS